MADRSLLLTALALLVACDPKPSGGHRDLHLTQTSGDLGDVVVAASSTEIDVPEGIGLSVVRDPGPTAVDFSTRPTSDDPSIATIRTTTNFDTFVVVGLKPGRTLLHFTDGEPTSVPVVVTAQP
jgi:hypothetical protein